MARMTNEREGTRAAIENCMACLARIKKVVEVMDIKCEYIEPSVLKASVTADVEEVQAIVGRAQRHIKCFLDQMKESNYEYPNNS